MACVRETRKNQAIPLDMPLKFIRYGVALAAHTRQEAEAMLDEHVKKEPTYVPIAVYKWHTTEVLAEFNPPIADFVDGTVLLWEC